MITAVPLVEHNCAPKSGGSGNNHDQRQSTIQTTT